MSSIYDKSSLVLIPSGTKTSKVYSQKPTNGDGDFDFTRSTAATRIAANGNIEKETQNLLLQSNSFDTTWTSSATNASVTGGQSDPNGGSSAWLVTESNDGGSIRQSVSVSGVLTFSMYLKYNSGATPAASLFCTDNNQNASFNLSTGVVYGLNNLIDASMEDVGGGWYRCSVTFNASAASTMILFPNNPAGIGSCFAWNAQLNQGLIAQEVITTTTTALYGGITDNVPRLDYTDSSCPALLLEPQRTNIIPYSEYLNHSSWIKNVNSSVSQNYAISPEGKQNASLISNTLVTGSCDYYVNLPGSASTLYTLSAFVKASTHSKCVLRGYVGHSGNGDTPAAIFDLSSGSVVQEYGVATNSDINPIGNDGWYRVQTTFLTAGTNLYFNILPLSDSYGWSSAYNAPNNYGSVGGILAFGAQVEANASYPTSYIPTYGTNVTRNADACNSAGDANTFNDSEGVLYAEIGALSNDLNIESVSISDTSAANRVVIFKWNTSNSIRARITSGGANINLDFQVTNITSINKIAVKYKTNDFALWINGVEVRTNTNGSNPSGLNQLAFNSDGGSGAHFYGNTKQILYFPTALSDTELATLTTI